MESDDLFLGNPELLYVETLQPCYLLWCLHEKEAMFENTRLILIQFGNLLYMQICHSLQEPAYCRI